LKRAGLKDETDSLLVAAQDQALNARYHHKNNLKQNENGMKNSQKQHHHHVGFSNKHRKKNKR
jgi:hypothetical protein